MEQMELAYNDERNVGYVHVLSRTCRWTRFQMTGANNRSHSWQQQQDHILYKWNIMSDYFIKNAILKHEFVRTEKDEIRTPTKWMKDDDGNPKTELGEYNWI